MGTMGFHALRQPPLCPGKGNLRQRSRQNNAGAAALAVVAEAGAAAEAKLQPYETEKLRGQPCTQ